MERRPDCVQLGVIRDWKTLTIMSQPHHNPYIGFPIINIRQGPQASQPLQSNIALRKQEKSSERAKKLLILIERINVELFLAAV